MKKLSVPIAMMAILAANPAHALLGRDFKVSASMNYDYTFGGSGGRFDVSPYHSSPELSEMFPYGYGGRVELGMNYDTNWEIIIGTGYIFYHGGSDTVNLQNGDVASVEVGDFTAIPLYVGGRFLFSDDPRKGLTPYLKADVGALFTQEVNAQVIYVASDFSRPTFGKNVNWYSASTSMMYELGGGLEYGIGKFGVFGEMLYKSYGTPEPSEATEEGMVSVNKKSSPWAPVSAHIGVSYYF